MKKDDCIFCKIANGEIPSDTVYEDEHFRAILDLSPASKGHTLVLPKEHFDDALSADDKTVGEIFKTAAKIAAAVKETMNCDGINIVQNNGEAAGQTVHHLHVHIIPRYSSEKEKSSHGYSMSLNLQSRRILRRVLRQNLAEII